MNCCPEFSMKLLRKQKLYERVVYNVVNLYQSQWCKVEKLKSPVVEERKDGAEAPLRKYLGERRESCSETKKCSSDKDGINNKGGKSEIAWLTEKLEPALQLCRRALPSGVFHYSSSFVVQLLLVNQILWILNNIELVPDTKELKLIGKEVKDQCAKTEKHVLN